MNRPTYYTNHFNVERRIVYAQVIKIIPTNQLNHQGSG